MRCDASQIERVLVNLIENAAKFSPPGAPVVLRARASDDDHVEIAVLDHGPGIALDQRERVFEPFYRGRGGGAGRHGPRASRSRAGSSRPTQARSRSTMLPGAARACASCCRP